MKFPLWRMDVIAPSGEAICSGTSTAIDASGTVHVSYRDGSGAVMHAWLEPEGSQNGDCDGEDG